ncbi:MAG: DivIVA domain-containing protein [Bacillota bacterium]
MKFSPLDIYNKEFKKSAFGYNSNEVDEFLDEVGLAYERLLKDYSSLEDEKERLEEKLESYKSIQDKLEGTLESVQETVRDQTRHAQREAQNIIKEAELEAEKIKQKARDEVQSEINKLENLKEKRELFKIRFRSLLENYMEIIEDEKFNRKIEIEQEVLSDKSNENEGDKSKIKDEGYETDESITGDNNEDQDNQKIDNYQENSEEDFIEERNEELDETRLNN